MRRQGLRRGYLLLPSSRSTRAARAWSLAASAITRSDNS